MVETVSNEPHSMPTAVVTVRRLDTETPEVRFRHTQEKAVVHTLQGSDGRMSETCCIGALPGMEDLCWKVTQETGQRNIPSAGVRVPKLYVIFEDLDKELMCAAKVIPVTVVTRIPGVCYMSPRKYNCGPSPRFNEVQAGIYL
jgi:hypothetical protein